MPWFNAFHESSLCEKMRQNSFFNYSRKERTGIGVLVTLMLLTAIFPRIFPHDRALASNTFVVGRGPNPADSNVETNDRAAWRTTSKPSSHPPHAGDEYLLGKSANESSKSRRYKDWPPPQPKHFPARPARRQIDINKADTSAFISLPFIGSKLAARIVLFRTKLGGFHSREQLTEVYGIQDSVYHIIEKFLACDAADIQKLNINHLDEERLKQHPYIRWKFASALCAFRRQHGNFDSLDELGSIKNIDSASLRKMLPYLTIQ